MTAAASFGAPEFQAATGVGDPVLADLEAFRRLLEDWSGRMNLVGPSALEQFWGRHAFDSAQLVRLAPDLRSWADVGTGAGFPGVVLAILGKDRPGMTVQLIESLEKRCVFLRVVVQALGLPATVIRGRAESLAGIEADVITARAVAPLPRLLSQTYPLLRRGAVGLFHKGRNVEQEIDEALQSWRFHYDLTPSLSDPEGRILRIWSLRRASA